MAPIASRLFREAAWYGAIAQLGERIVRNDEVGGSIPPGSTTPLGYAWRSVRSLRAVPGEAPKGEVFAKKRL